ncbi:hypothetical protein E2C01_006568 [Portunus trituberculatus]|uniref:Uncharacterized protein n=1 Tax=Portunus trituberculatus TaxID=210409 RepID=A0A5B7CWP7_PORTR|nr:hypothetical protein [Portunus trituberculatus]
METKEVRSTATCLPTRPAYRDRLAGKNGEEEREAINQDSMRVSCSLTFWVGGGGAANVRSPVTVLSLLLAALHADAWTRSETAGPIINPSDGVEGSASCAARNS